MPKNPDGGPDSPPEPVSSSGGSSSSSSSTQPDNAERRPTARAAPTARGATPADPSSSAGGASRAGHTVSERKKQFLIAPRQQPGGLTALAFQPLQFDAVEQALRGNPDIEVIGTVGPKDMGVLGTGMGGGQGVLVARMSQQKATELHQQGQGRLLVERDQHLAMLEPSFRMPGLVSGMMPAAGAALDAIVKVLGRDGAPLADAEVSLFGSLLPATAVTDANGMASLTLYGETANTISGLYVKPKADYWSFYQRDPDISTTDMNVVALRALSDWPNLPGFPQQKAFGWGQKAMRLDQLPGNYRGQGIRIAVIDSGVATTHQNLSRINAGFDIIHKATSPQTWNEDSLGHGSHCTAVIAGADIASGVRGFAPDAEVHACKLFPGGQISQLIDALEYCIEKQVDVVNLSLGGAEPSEALEQQILRAKRAGIACIVAAGNSGGAVQYPASSPHVLAVAAIGKLDEFPPDSYHAETLTPNVDAAGYFPASFSCQGPQVAVCGPGVAIASAVPPNNFAAWDGTSMAAPHITGLAALVLAHHPDFQALYKARTADRVERLFQLIKMSARRVSLGEQARTGFGLPDVLVAVGLQAPLGQMTAQHGTVPGAALGSLLGGGGPGAVGLGAMAHPIFAASAFEPFGVGLMGGGHAPGFSSYSAFVPGGQFGQQAGMMPFSLGPPGFVPSIW